MVAATLHSAPGISGRTIDIFRSFPKPYFTSVIVWYNLALLVTGVVMFWFNHAQPALLYLCPAIFISIIKASRHK